MEFEEHKNKVDTSDSGFFVCNSKRITKNWYISYRLHSNFQHSWTDTLSHNSDADAHIKPH